VNKLESAALDNMCLKANSALVRVRVRIGVADLFLRFQQCKALMSIRGRQSNQLQKILENT